MASEEKAKSKNDEVIARALDRFSFHEQTEAHINESALEDERFLNGDQWPAAIKQSRSDDKRPMLTINKLPQHVHQITNDQRQNRPSIKVSGVDDNADKFTAEVYQGLIRHIQHASNADVAYDTGFEFAAKSGRGYFRIVSDYCHPMSFEQDLFIKAIKDPRTVRIDPYYQEPDGSDANWGFVEEMMSKEDFEQEFGETELSKHADWSSLSKDHLGWVDGDSCRIVEYYEKEYEPTTIYKLPDGSVVDKNDKILEGLEEDELKELPSRKTNKIIIKHYKLNALEVLEETTWPGRFIPIVPIHGEEYFEEDGRRNFQGVVRQAKDPQRMYNYWKSQEAEVITLAPKSPYIGAEGQFSGHRKKWESAHVKNYPYLEYKPTTLANGQLAPPPQRNFSTVDVSSITQAGLFANDDIKSTIGQYDASLGMQSNEVSGRAIRERKAQGQTSNFHYVDNLSRSIGHGGRILVDVIPHFYDTARAVRTIGEDGKEEIIKINEVLEDGKQVNFSHGQYDVMCSTGPSYATKRQEAAEHMLEFIRVYPAAAQVMGDILAQSMDWPGADKLAERLQSLLPPQLQEKKGEQLPPEVQAHLAQMEGAMGEMQKKIQELEEEKRVKLMELESKERIEMQKIEADMRIEAAKLDSHEGIELLRQEIKQLDSQQKQQMELMGQFAPVENFQDYRTPQDLEADGPLGFANQIQPDDGVHQSEINTEDYRGN